MKLSFCVLLLAASVTISNAMQKLPEVAQLEDVVREQKKKEFEQLVSSVSELQQQIEKNLKFWKNTEEDFRNFSSSDSWRYNIRMNEQLAFYSARHSALKGSILNSKLQLAEWVLKNYQFLLSNK